MADDIREQLRDLGYLSNPVSHWLWGRMRPGWRSHMRHFSISCAVHALTLSAITASLTGLNGSDRFGVAGFYVVVACLLTLCLDLLIGWVMSVPVWLEQLRRGQRLNAAWLVGWLACFFLLVFWLRPNIKVQTATAQVILFIALGFTAWCWAGSLRLLTISRLYWFGHRPPRFRPHYLWFACVLGLLVVVEVVWSRAEKPRPKPASSTQMLVLAFDMPVQEIEPFLNRLPNWQASQFEVSESDISAFWTRFGTGIPHLSSSLMAYNLGFFQDALNPQDRTLKPVVWLSQMLGLAKPTARSTRLTKYIWEIFDEQGLTTYAFGFWHTFPAELRRGGVLSERWDYQHQTYPYSSGLPALNLSEPEMTENPNVTPFAQREAATWSLLGNLTTDFDFAIAYFPLADVLGQSGPLPQGQNRENAISALNQRRVAQIESLLARLPEETMVSIVATSGRDRLDHGLVQCSVLHSPQYLQRAQPLLSELDFAPTVLNLYHLPADRRMHPSQLNSNDIPQPISYRARLELGPRHRDDDDYLEQLRSLGYVK